MKQVRVGDKVRAFLDARIAGEVVEIFHRPSSSTVLMVGGVPPSESFAKVLLEDGRIVVIKTIELSHNI